MTYLPRVATLLIAVLCCRELAAQAPPGDVREPANESTQAVHAPQEYDSPKAPPRTEGFESDAQPGPRAHRKNTGHWKHGKKHWKKNKGHRNWGEKRWKNDEYRRGARTHDGFFFRWAFGFGGYHEWLRSDEVADVSGDLDAQIVGIGKVREVAMGGTLTNGLVFGGGLFDVSVLAGSTKVDDDLSLPSDIAPIPRSITLIGPFIDWYPQVHRGFHVFGALGFAHMHSVGIDARPFESDSYDAKGAALALGLGYDWWISDQWSLGALGRMTVGGLVGEDDADAEWGHAFATWPALMFAATYH